MKRAVLVKQGKVLEAVITGPGYQPPKGFHVIETETANIGDKHDGTGFVDSEAKSIPKQELKDYARFRHHTNVKQGIDFNLAEPGDDPDIVHIQTDIPFREEIRDLAWRAEITGEDTTVVTYDRVLHLTPKQLMRLRECIVDHVHRSHAVAAKLIESIESGHVASMHEIEAPEKATAVKLTSWHKPNA